MADSPYQAGTAQDAVHSLDQWTRHEVKVLREHAGLAGDSDQEATAAAEAAVAPTSAGVPESATAFVGSLTDQQRAELKAALGQ
jgi:hypothetical protein